MIPRNTQLKKGSQIQTVKASNKNFEKKIPAPSAPLKSESFSGDCYRVRRDGRDGVLKMRGCTHICFCLKCFLILPSLIYFFSLGDSVCLIEVITCHKSSSWRNNPSCGGKIKTVLQ
jgi:hypothetical protein